jgi:sulfur-oxidizing protein SoxB
VPRFSNVSLLHFTDCHAQLLPSYYRETDTNIGAGVPLNPIANPRHFVPDWTFGI